MHSFVRRSGVRLWCLVAALAVLGWAGQSELTSREHQAAAAPAGGSGGVNRPEHRARPHLVLVSADGFKPEYLDRPDLPNVRRLVQRGTRAKGMTPVFPSLTFPNHYSLVTGLLPARHGIVNNTFYDPARRQTYSLSDRAAVEDGTWYGGEPIWVTAERQGMVAACFFWPGSEAAIQGIRPSYWKRYDAAITGEDKVAAVVDWLRFNDERRPHMITMYFSEVDSASHLGRLDAPGVADAIRSLDRYIGQLLDGVDALPIRDRVYLLLTSDHGMIETSLAQTIRLESLVDLRGVLAFGGPVAALHVTDGRRRPRELRDAINATLAHGRAYLRGELPARFAFRTNPRAGDVVIVMNEGWTIAVGQRRSTRASDRWGAHGWDPALPSMQATFVASGPGIRAGATVGTVRNIDVYPFMAEALGLRAPPNLDGRAGVLRGLLVGR